MEFYMLKSCPYCGRIHTKTEQCERQPKPWQRGKYNKTDSPVCRFRNSRQWRKKRETVKARDGYCCQMCIEEPAPNARQFNSKDLQVHHIVPLAKDFEQRLDEGNLITLCPYHHSMAERGAISVQRLRDLIKKQSPRV